MKRVGPSKASLTHLASARLILAAFAYCSCHVANCTRRSIVATMERSWSGVHLRMKRRTAADTLAPNSSQHEGRCSGNVPRRV